MKYDVYYNCPKGTEDKIKKTKGSRNGWKVESMTRTFEDRVKRERIVDTKSYRYVFRTLGDKAEIRRLPITLLDTTGANTDWETIKTYY